MLGVFQEVAKKLADSEVGGIATFDLMFEGIRTALKSSVQQSIQIAERNIDDPVAVRVLKALFLVKYVKGFKPTVRNIGVLLLSEFDADQTERRREIEEALATLERNTLIQRNGEVYEFLTNEEKDVEAEIKNLDVDHSELSKAIEELAYDTILRHRKITHSATSHDYSFSRKLDDHLLGREYELSVNIITPFNDDADATEAVRMRNLGREELAVLLGSDVRFVRDLTLYKQTDKFIRQSRAGMHQAGRDRIIAEKGEQNGRRLKDLELRLRKLIAASKLFVRGDELDIGGDEAQERLTKAFQVLIDKVYVNLPMLRGVSYAESDIAKASKLDGGLFGAADDPLREEEQELLNHVQAQARNGVKVSAKSLTERFSQKPCGWPVTAILCLSASLVTKGKLEARSDSTVLEGNDLTKALNNSHALPNILLTPQVEFTAAQIRKAKDLYKELFGLPADGTDARSLGGEWAESTKDLSNEIATLAAQTTQYPFMIALDPLSKNIAGMVGKPAAWYITDAPKLEDDLLNAKEDVLDKIRSFMGGEQKGIYDEAREFVTLQEANISYVDPTSGEKLKAALNDPECFKGTVIQDLKSDLYALKEKVELQVLEERKAVEKAVGDCAVKISQTSEFQALTSALQAQIKRSIDSHKGDLDQVKLIPILRDQAAGARTTLVSKILGEIAELNPPKPAPNVPDQGGDGNGDEGADGGVSDQPQTPFVTQSYVNATDLHISFDKPYLSDESEVDEYLDELKKALVNEISKGKKVII